MNDPILGEPTLTDRGFVTYTGDQPIRTSYGHVITVRESSSAEGPHVWLFIGPSATAEGHDPHLDLAQAIALRSALTRFISDASTRWERGPELLTEAVKAALGEDVAL